MIIDLLLDKSNIINISYKDEANSNLLVSSFTTKSISDIQSWKVINPSLTTIQFTIISCDTCLLQDITYNLPAWVNIEDFTIETSIDYINWYELPYIKSNPSDINDKYYFYSSIDDLGNKTYIYSNYEFKMMRFTFKGQVPTGDYLQFNNLAIMIDETLNLSYIKKNLLSIRSSMFSKSKIFNEQPFLADMVTTYLQMLETNNTLKDAPEYKTNYLQNSTFSLTSN